jgi:hypothetical protein
MKAILAGQRPRNQGDDNAARSLAQAENPSKSKEIPQDGIF